MTIIYTTDNKDWHKPNILQQKDIENLTKLANIEIGRLSFDDRSKVLVFPHNFNTHCDKIHEQTIISLNHKDEIKTGNIMGFIGINETQLDIRSRFAENDKNDCFIHYMLQKVFKINIFDLEHNSSREPIFDFLVYLFPNFLKRALSQGIFKKYRRNEYNNVNVRGPINVNQHIRMNILFHGKVAYATRERSYDNEITQLIRHTIEYIRTKPASNYILSNDEDTIACVAQIMEATQSYNLRNRTKIIGENLKPFTHPYYSEYAPLQKLCLQILHHETIKFGNEKDKIYGVLFDGAWLWEEYLWTILEDAGFTHPHNKEKNGGLRMFKKLEEDDLFKKNSRKLYPDFYKEENGQFKFILDAKYKHIENGVGREDLYQVVSYMYCTKSPYGGYIYPIRDNQTKAYVYQLNGYGGSIHVFPFYIPNKSNYKEFVKDIETSEKKLLDSI